MLERQYEQWAQKQADSMVETAERMRPNSFHDDCLQRPSAIVRHWRSLVDVRWTSQFEDGSSYEHVQGLRGQYLPAKSPDELPVIRVARQRVAGQSGKGYYPRECFTLLHELGHHLQASDLQLFANLQAIRDTGKRKDAEERACDIFAAKALLPDSLFDGGREPDASLVVDLYEHRHASRQVIVRRLAPMLKTGSWITLLNLDESWSPSFRVHANGWAVYANSGKIRVEPVERAAAEKMRKADHFSATFTPADFPGIADIDTPGIISVARPERGTWLCVVAAKQ